MKRKDRVTNSTEDLGGYVASKEICSSDVM